MKTEALLERLHVIDSEYRRLEHAAALLQWDQETYLPRDAVEERAEQLGLLEGIAHERIVSPEVGKLLSELGSTSENPRGDESLPALERDFLRILRRNYDRQIKLPPDFVRSSARAEGLSQAAWIAARSNDDFTAFVPHLAEMVSISRKKAEYWGAGGAVYDALLDIYEPGITAREIEGLFEPLKLRLKTLLNRIGSVPQIHAPFLSEAYDCGAQHTFSMYLLDYLGFDQNRGRLDTSAHPFTTTLGADDVRITTRFIENNVVSSIFSTIHEMGHAFYEMGFPAELRGTSLGEGVSMGIHESQSRLWENVIGRSASFWQGLYPEFRQRFSGRLKAVSMEDFVRGINRVEPSLIRIEADEVTYSLHIILRFELEQQLFSGALSPEDLPKTWNARMRDLLGTEPQTNADGVLQDVHWSMGAFGYFPSYALGNLYGLQFWRKLNADIPHAEAAIAQGEFAGIREWLRDTLYVWGSRLEPAELLFKVCGEKLSVDPFAEYLERKYSDIYGF
ncbi:carboxypeptidase M32 [Breznakiella homolactica]|uniref:Metal-dependent carboxypeptidase n=1 Tax=Breznakiella homolactica TaxID=2798577 RepID=A0A7T7XQL3_9SPIR|nr:carboxypeptidase M32 [Breznakiella homolactica]QQO10680.1 carboxypeptidase M32 [Breznakiella homolactica]